MDKTSEHRIYEFGDFRLDAAHLMLFRGGEEIQLAPKAVETLLALIARRGEIVSKAELLEAVWPDTAVEESNLFLYLSVLRKTLGTRADGAPWIETYRRRGYRFARDDRSLLGGGPGSHYAWLVGLDGKSDPAVQTQSGRMYMLRDPMLGESDHAAAAPISNDPAGSETTSRMEKTLPRAAPVFFVLLIASAFVLTAVYLYLTL